MSSLKTDNTHKRAGASAGAGQGQVRASGNKARAAGYTGRGRQARVPASQPARPGRAHGASYMLPHNNKHTGEAYDQVESGIKPGKS